MVNIYKSHHIVHGHGRAGFTDQNSGI